MQGGYHPDRPHRPEHYPDSLRESRRVARAMSRPDLEFFRLTDESPRPAFTRYMDSKDLDYDPQELETIILDSVPIIMAHKEFYNRPRPAQINPDIVPEPSETADTPAYPSGHAFQSYLLARHLSRRYPAHSFAFYRIADRIARARVSVGLHYPSDNRAAHRLAHGI